MTHGTRSFSCAVVLLLVIQSVSVPAQQDAVTGQPPAAAYPNGVGGLQKLLQDILKASKSKDTTKENELIQTLIMPSDSAWFKDEFGPAFGPRLAAAYQREAATIGQQLQTVYDGNAKRGWLTPKIFQYADAANVNSPIDNFLNCMDEVSPIYQTAFNGVDTRIQLGPPGDGGRLNVIAGDPQGYYVYAKDGFRYIPQQILMMLPKERPIRIQLDMNVMRSKITNQIKWTYPTEAIKQGIKGKVVIHLALDTLGRIKEITPVEGPSILSEAVSDAVKQWKFEPTTLDGEPVEVELNVGASFQLGG